MKKKDVLVVCICFIISFVCLFICSKSSPLYVFNNDPDINAFYTVSRCWINGIIPYRDIFEQKGPLLYLIFVIANFISNKSFIGIFIIELLSMTVFTYYIYKIMILFLSKNKSIYLLLFLFISSITGSRFFVYGCKAEEFCLPLLAITLYSLLIFLLKNKKINNIRLFINGVIAGCIFMIKFNLIGFWGIYLLIILYWMVRNNFYKEMILKLVFFMLGFCLVIIPFFIYFYIVNGLKDFVYIYFYFNTFSYASFNNSFIIKAIRYIMFMVRNIYYGKFICLFIIIGIISFLVSKKYLINRFNKICFIMFFIGGSLGIYGAGDGYLYYFLMFVILEIFGLIFIYDIFNRINKGRIINIIMIICIISLAIFFIFNSISLEYLGKNKKDLIQYKFSKIIKEKNGKSILNYGRLDGGFYMTSNILPSTKYFEFQNTDIKELHDELDKKIANKEFDFIVYIYFDDNYDKVVTDNYKLIIKYDEIMWGTTKFYYSLFEKN